MNRPPTYRRKTWREKAPPRPTRGTGLQIAGILLALAAGCLLWLHFYTTGKAEQTMWRTLDQMRVEYHLDEQQLERISAMEREFHGSGNPFTRPSHTLGEVRQHELAISAVMNPEDAARFLSKIEKKDEADPLKPLPVRH